MQLDEELAVTLTAAISRLDRVITAGQPDGVSVSEMIVLSHLAEQPGIGPAELAVMDSMRPPSVARHVKALLARGFIGLEPHPRDGRRVQVTVTEQGREALEQARKMTWLTARIADLDDADRDTLAGAVRVLGLLSN